MFPPEVIFGAILVASLAISVPSRGQPVTNQALGSSNARAVETSDAAAKANEAFLKEKMERRFSGASAYRASVYGPFLAELGLTPDRIDTVVGRLDALHRGAVKAGEPMQELMIARADYLREMRSLLGAAGFAKYEAFELAKPYRREVDLIAQYAAEQKRPLDPKLGPRLAELLQEFRLHTTESWDGPYDPAPRPLAGTGPIVADIDEYTTRITAGLPRFTAKASTEFTPELRKLVSDYYATKLQKFGEARVRASMSLEERMAEAQRMIEQARAKAIAGQGKAVPDL